MINLTGVSKAMQAMIFGHKGACGSGLELTISNNVSAASKPPILRSNISTEYVEFPALNYLCPQSTIFAFPAPPPVPLATSLSTVRVVNQSANRSTASFCVKSK